MINMRQKRSAQLPHTMNVTDDVRNSRVTAWVCMVSVKIY